MHGLIKSEAIDIVRKRLEEIEEDLRDGTLSANIGDDTNHVVKIVCGRGIHSKGRAVLKYAIPEFLEEEGYDIYNNDEHGNVLVRL